MSLFSATKEVRRQHHREKELSRASCISPSIWPPWSCTQPRSLASLPCQSATTGLCLDAAVFGYCEHQTRPALGVASHVTFICPPGRSGQKHILLPWTSPTSELEVRRTCHWQDLLPSAQGPRLVCFTSQSTCFHPPPFLLSFLLPTKRDGPGWGTEMRQRTQRTSDIRHRCAGWRKREKEDRNNGGLDHRGRLDAVSGQGQN